MCAAKSPISILQEYTTAQHLPLPTYNIIQQGSGFQCTATVGSYVATVTAASKKNAKHKCAEGILELIDPRMLSNFDSDQKPVPVTQVPIVQTLHIVDRSEDGPFFNAIGQLNELCSQKGLVYPMYQEAGIVEKKFVIRCRLRDKLTTGYGPTKKQAKQMAAKEMLHRISMHDFNDVINIVQVNLEQSKPKPASTVEVDKILELFKQLSTRNTKQQLQEVQTNQCLQSSESRHHSEVKVDADLEHFTEKMLREELQRLNINFRIYEFQEDPLLLVLETVPTKVHTQYTFIHSDATYDLTVFGLLRKAVRDIKLMQK